MNAYESADDDFDVASVFAQFPTLETENLYLRELQPADAADLFRIFGDEDVTRFYDLYAYHSVAQARELIDFFAESFELERAIRWGIARKHDNVIIGTCGYVWLRQFRGEIGYELGRAYWRQGIMSEALPAIVDFGFQQLGLNRVEALVMVDNVASAELLRSLGFHEEGILREHDFFKEQFHDMRCFSMLKKDFYAHASQ